MRIDLTIPQKPVSLRPMAANDASQVAKWVDQGRSEGVFLRGTHLSVHSVLQYQSKMQQSGWNYRCQVIEFANAGVGYVDYRHLRTIGEILGIYLEPWARRKGVGEYALHWVLAALRDVGCQKVRGEVYDHNSASIQTIRAAGFKLSSSGHRIEDNRRVLAYYRYLSPYPRLTPYSEQFRTLHGRNQYLRLAALAEVLIRRIRAVKSVDVILGLGALSRGFADEFSDLDLAVLGHGSEIRGFWRGERWLAGLSVDVYPVDTKIAPPCRWDESRRQAFGEGVVLFARNTALLRDIEHWVRLRDNERVEKIKELIFHIGWIGFEPRTWFGREKHGYVWSLPFDLWVRRGDIASAHLTVDYALDYAIRLLFLTNGSLVPDPKWRRFLANGLPWLPPKFGGMLTRAELGTRDHRGFFARAQSVLTIIEGTIRHLEKEGVIRGDIYNDYLRNSTDYDPMI